MHDDDDDWREKQSAWRGKADPMRSLREGKDVQHKAQISSIMFIILSYCTVV